MRRSRTLAFGVVVLGVVAVVGWVLFSAASRGGKHDALDALVADPLAARAQANAHLIFADDRSAKSSDPVTGKPRTTQVLRTFAPATGADLLSLQRQLGNLAGRSGWTITTAADGSMRGSKNFSFGAADLVIAINRFTSPATVSTTLTPTDPNL